jgi:alpha-L-rhamnosidase
MKYSALACAAAILWLETSSASTLSIGERGAVSDGNTMNTRAIQAAVDDCAAKGGGTVLVLAGVWRTGSVGLKSGVCLRLEAGAVLRASDRL